jgi:hypothetical protein
VGTTLPDQLEAGHAILATLAPRRTNVGRSIDYSTRDTQALLSQNEIMSPYPEANPASVRVKESVDDDSVNDFLLTTVKYRSHGGFLNLTVSPVGKREPAPTTRKITLVAEVDDNNQARQDNRYRYVVFELWGGGLPPGKPTTDVVARPLFRVSDESRANAPSPVMAKLIRLPSFFDNEKSNQPIGLAPQSELDRVDGTIRFRRWDMMRLHGDFALHRLTIGNDPQPINGVKDF